MQETIITDFTCWLIVAAVLSVSIIQRGNHVLPTMDPEMSGALADELAAQYSTKDAVYKHLWGRNGEEL